MRLILLLVVFAAVAYGRSLLTTSRLASRDYSSSPQVQNCSERWFVQTLDHFTPRPGPNGETTFQQRYFVCNQFYNSSNGAVFFYPGNEADVTLYVTHTGLMWENAQAFGAVMIFVEHRYFGKSLPFGASSTQYLWYLSTEQAQADYAVFISEELPRLGIFKKPVITFGGSYGGMLSSWMRMKYPHLVQGSIAASAPIVAFYGDTPAYDQESFSRVVTQDAGHIGGCSDMCASNFRTAYQKMFALGATAQGRANLAKWINICQALNNTNDVSTLANWVSSASSYMAMGDYPYPSSYILNGDGMLPAFPVRVSCEQFSGNYTSDSDMFIALGRAMETYYNATGTSQCYNILGDANNDTLYDAEIWGYLACYEMVMPMGQDGVNDMFWPAPFSLNATIEGCRSQFQITPRYNWIAENFGGWNLTGTTNIFFSNGNLDPWSTGGITTRQKGWHPSIATFIIKDGAHHLDLMFSNPLDPQSVLDCRAQQRQHMRTWVSEYYQNMS